MPVVPGSEGARPRAEEARRRWPSEIGYPVILKAAAGGGGRGMRIVARRRRARRRPSARPTREAEAAFGNADVYLEKYVERPRHIEFQVLADAHGNVVHLGERECSIQRRHQKLIEEAPSPPSDAGAARGDGRGRRPGGRSGPTTTTRARSSSCSTEHGSFYFMEMNTRIQVEHPVTEMVTGIDLVKEQIRVAAGEPLRWTAGGRRACAATPSSAASTPRIRSPSRPRRARSPATPARRPRRARRHLRLRGLRGAAVLRLADRQAHRPRRTATRRSAA